MAATTSTASAIMGNKLSAPRAGRVSSSHSSGLRKRIMPGRVKAVIEDTSKKNDSTSISKDILDNVEFVAGGSKADFSSREAYEGTAFAVRERLVESFNSTMKYMKEKDPKFVYYLSAEFLMGRSLLNTVYNLGLKDEFADSLNKLGYDLEQLVEEERDAALGNGGLGRLAACFLDSIATLSLPGWGYGIRYRYGMFKQIVDDKGYQQEVPDVWLTTGNPWDIPRYNIQFPVGFYGEVKDGKWIPGEEVIALAYDTPIPGFQTNNTMNLRLWEAKPINEFNLQSFNDGDYVDAILDKQRAEAISAVLYPNDNTAEGKELRLKQQYFFVAASIQDIVKRFKETHANLADLPTKAAVQMNDTHPTIAVPELMRILMDQEGLTWDAAWDITYKTMNFTNHTVMPEALERWPVSVMDKLLPRHSEIIKRIDNEWRAQMEERYASMKSEEDAAKEAAKEKSSDSESSDSADVEELSEYEKFINSLCIIQENQWNKGEMLINMAVMAVVGSTYVNGVAAIHSDIIKNQLFSEYNKIFPDKFQNKTNGVTPRRWLAFCNPGLSALITETLGTDAWINDMTLLTGLREYAEDKEFQKKWIAIKHDNKKKLADKIKATTGVELDTNTMFDVQIKRIHQYKRQLMNIMSIIYRWDELKKMSPEERAKQTPRSCIIGGKAASAYDMAKRIVRLANCVGEKINTDPDTKDYLKLVFIPDYNVSWAEVLIPGAELSQHISTAGTEASGTSNMKFQMNGSLIIGTMDGANIEIAEESGKENLFIFGVLEDVVPQLREDRVKDGYKTDPRYDYVLDMIRNGTFNVEDGDNEYFRVVADDIGNMKVGNDWFLVAADFASYLDSQAEADECYKNQEEWTRRSIMYTAGSAKFSSDRTIAQYAEEIWKIQPLPVPDNYS